jgi:hypothetical protein
MLILLRLVGLVGLRHPPPPACMRQSFVRQNIHLPLAEPTDIHQGKATITQHSYETQKTYTHSGLLWHTDTVTAVMSTSTYQPTKSSGVRDASSDQQHAYIAASFSSPWSLGQVSCSDDQTAANCQPQSTYLARPVRHTTRPGLQRPFGTLSYAQLRTTKSHHT